MLLTDQRNDSCYTYTLSLKITPQKQIKQQSDKLAAHAKDAGCIGRPPKEDTRNQQLQEQLWSRSCNYEQPRRC